jgi:hypothetical protein
LVEPAPEDKSPIAMTDPSPNPPNPRVRIVLRPDFRPPVPEPRSSGEIWRAELGRTAARDRWGLATIAIGWLHLACFAALQGAYASGDRTPWHYVAAWAAEVLGVAALMRLIAGPRWSRSSPAAGVVVRVWVTYLILAFNLASMNHLSGDPIDWYRPAWTTLGSFGFATMAWLADLRFLLAAVQMYATGMLILRWPEWGFLIHGASWCLALSVIGGALRRRRARWLAGA